LKTRVTNFIKIILCTF